MSASIVISSSWNLVSLSEAAESYFTSRPRQLEVGGLRTSLDVADQLSVFAHVAMSLPIFYMDLATERTRRCIHWHQRIESLRGNTHTFAKR